MSDLTTLFAARLSESEIPERAAKHAGLIPLDALKVAKLYAGAPRQSAMQIRYYDPLSRDTGFYRLRLLGKPLGGIQLEKPKRYLQPPNSGVLAYFPRVAGVHWGKVLTDPTVPLIITEGEMKALAATLSDFPTIGLGGVENWREKGAASLLLKELAAAEWKDRHVYICYDSDVAIKPQVMVAARRLAEELGAYGAHVYDAGLPAGATEEKVGLDDFLRDRGPKALADHLRGASEFQHVKALHDFNDRFLFIRSAGKVYEVATEESYDAAKFCTAVEVNTRYYVPKLTPDGVKTEKRYVARDWLEWPRRRAVQRMSYRPGQEGLIVVDDKGILELNRWTGWGVKPKRGNVDLWRTLFDHMTENESVEVRKWFEQWIAYPLKHPGAKLHTAVALWSAATGTGKTLLGESLIRIYGQNAQRIGVKQLQGAFNSWASNKQFVMGDEITGSEQRQHADELKSLITGESIRVNEKYEKEYELPNVCNFYFTSNHPDAFFIDDKDRRFLIVEGPSERLSAKFYDAYDKWYRSEEGTAALFYHLLQVNTEGFNPYAEAPRTAAHSVMVEQNRSDVGRFISEVMNDPVTARRLYNVPEDIDVFTARELLKFYDPRGERRVSERAVSLELQKQGAKKLFGGIQVRIESLGQLRLFAVRNGDSWMRKRKEVVKKYVEERKLPTPKF